MRLARPTAAELHVWYGEYSHGDEQSNWPLLSLDERSRGNRLRKDVDRARFVAVHGSVRRIFGGYLGVDPASIRFGRSRCPKCGDAGHGPPRLASPGTDLTFSLSHSGAVWMLAVAPGGPVGVDIECGAHPETTSAITEALSPAERAAYEIVYQEADRRSLLLRAWTRKEAVCKAIGIGIVGDLPSIDVFPDVRGPVRVASACHVSDPGDWDVFDIACDAAHAAACARPFGQTTRVVQIHFAVREGAGEPLGVVQV